MGNFLPALNVVLDHEYPRGVPWDVVDTPGDKGGLTASTGITFTTMKAALGAKADLDGDGKVDEKDFRLFCHDREMQIEILHRVYWIEPGFDNIRNAIVATKMFDLAVHAGPHAAIVILQRAVNSIRPYGMERLSEDGSLGPLTLRSVSQCDPEILIPSLCAEQAQFYLRCIEHDPTNAQFKSNWLSRAKWPGDAVMV